MSVFHPFQTNDRSTPQFADYQSGGDLEPEADMRTNVELEFEVDEHGRVWMIREGDCHIIGRRNAVCSEMRRFLRMVLLAPGN
jgi:hypothetical protein